MSDRKLLEAAAMAAGIDGRWGREGYIERREGFIPSGSRRAWDPLKDDGDALRLAVKLKLDIQQSATVPAMEPSVEAFKCADDGEVNGYSEEVKGNDPYAATRRAIVCAAAALAASQQSEGAPAP